MTSPSDVLQMVKDNDVKFVDYRLTDTRARHCALLDDDLQLKNIYSIISNSIWETSKKI